jgi:hypothetical protein
VRLRLLLFVGPAGQGGLRPFHEVLNQILKDRRVELVVNLLPLSVGQHEPSLTKNGKVAGDRWPRGIEVTGNLARRSRAGAKQPKNVSTRLVAKRAERVV